MFSLPRGGRALLCDPQLHLDGAEEWAKGVGGPAKGPHRLPFCALILPRSHCVPRLSSNGQRTYCVLPPPPIYSYQSAYRRQHSCSSVSVWHILARYKRRCIKHLRRVSSNSSRISSGVINGRKGRRA